MHRASSPTSCKSKIGCKASLLKAIYASDRKLGEPETMRLMGIDLGEKRIGLALSDASAIVASPLAVIPASGDDEADAQRVAEVASQHQVGEFVIGLARTLSGTEEQAAARAARFAQVLSEVSGKPVRLWDERLTTAQAERAMIEAGVRRAKRRESVDKVAAALILQSYLDAHHGQIEPEAPTDKDDP